MVAWPLARYTQPMSKTKASKSRAPLRQSGVKPPLVPKGYGALKGQFEIRPGIDLTKPIYEQVLKLEQRERRRRKP
jgi:hypothetical protein